MGGPTVSDLQLCLIGNTNDVKYIITSKTQLRCLPPYHEDEKVCNLLEEHNDPGRVLVVSGVRPHQTDEVEDSRELLGQLQVVHLFHCFKVLP